MEKSEIRWKALMFWIYKAVQMVKIYAAAIVGLLVYRFMLDEIAANENIVFYTGYLLVGLMANASFSTYSASQNALALGSTRKELFVGIQLYFGLVIGQMEIIYMLTAAIFFSEAMSLTMIIMFLFLCLFSVGIAEIASGLSVDFERKRRNAIQLIVFLIMMILFIGLLVFAQIMNISFVDMSMNCVLLFGLLLIGIIIYVLGTLCMKKELSRMEVEQ